MLFLDVIRYYDENGELQDYDSYEIGQVRTGVKELQKSDFFSKYSIDETGAISGK